MTKTKLYQPYITEIQRALRLGNKRSYDSFTGETKADIVKGMFSESRELQPKTGLHELARLLGITEIKKPFKGDHPDFVHLRSNPGVDYHYIVSMFIDVKGSTQFHRKYTLEQIALIIQTIVAAATHTIALFGGHIQRLQYDGVFCYFGGRAVSKEAASKAAIDAASFFSYFIKHELKEIFEIEGIENVFTRVGIDFGDDKDVQWVIFGTPGCDELTTNSLHTSLAPKMQSKAKPNGIMIGHNLRERLGKAQLFTDLLRDAKSNVDENERYIFRNPDEDFYYTQYTFEWPAYLKESYWFIKRDPDGGLYIDYTASASQSLKDGQSLNNLYEKTGAIAAGKASIDQQGRIQANTQGITIPQNRFYYDGSKLEKGGDS
jgi:class 3 adenylate cyclase